MVALFAAVSAEQEVEAQPKMGLENLNSLCIAGKPHIIMKIISHTPPKTNIDTKNDVFFKFVPPFKDGGILGIQPFVFGV